ncbi:hypothetical protein TSMEX_002026, partial [Taenia solium]
MKCALNLFVVLALVGLAFSYTFYVPVEKDWRTGRPYVYYGGRKHYLTDDPEGSHIVFLKNNCVIDLNLEKSSRDPYRDGSAICKSQFGPAGDAAWMNYVDARLLQSPVPHTHHTLSTRPTSEHGGFSAKTVR